MAAQRVRIIRAGLPRARGARRTSMVGWRAVEGWGVAPVDCTRWVGNTNLSGSSPEAAKVRCGGHTATPALAFLAGILGGTSMDRENPAGRLELGWGTLKSKK